MKYGNTGVLLIQETNLSESDEIWKYVVLLLQETNPSESDEICCVVVAGNESDRI